MALNNVPISGQTLNASRPLINANFITIDTAFSVNHVAYNDPGGNQGKHNFLSMPIQNPVPAAPAATDGQLYAALGAISGVTELFWRRTNANTLRSFTEGSINSPGWTMLPSGLLMKWATVDTGAATGDININTNASPFPFVGGVALENGPDFAGVSHVQVTMSGPNNASDPNTFVRIINLGVITRIYSTQRTTTNPASSIFLMLVLGSRA